MRRIGELLFILVCLTACGSESTEEPASFPFELRPLSTSADLRIVDDQGRDMLLRGVNITSLGEYWQGDPDNPPTMPTTEADWRDMAAAGVSAVRLIVHWSRIEPKRGQIDQGYLDKVDSYVKVAAQHGIYTVIDMHQDAYTAFIHTPPEETCPKGTKPARGWDGAPAWAVFTDGLSTCTPGDRNGSPAVQAAWNHFYNNKDGIRDRFVASWAAVAARFAGRPEVAGYDIINEPETSSPSEALTPLYDKLLHDCWKAIRDAEKSAPFAHLILVEPTIPAGDNTMGVIIPDPKRAGMETVNVVSAPHNYAETIPLPGLSMTFELMNEIYVNVAETAGVPTWIGEYGFWDTSESTLEKLSRYALDEDKRRLGGTWWQWRQPCGDPHTLGQTDRSKVVHIHQLGCPGDVDLGPTPAFMRVLGRGYARATPGRLLTLESDPEGGRLLIEAKAAVSGGELLVWTPTKAKTHAITTEGLKDVRERDVAGGRLVSGTVSAAGIYVLRVTPLP